MELCSDEQFQPCFMDSLYLPSYIPSSFYYQQEIVPTGSISLVTETINGTTMKQEKDLEKRRKKIDASCVTTAQSKSKGRRRNNGGSGKKQMEEKQPPTDYIHVRARRGQATDSHSLAERVRRERISERMKTLQGLVPGCDKVSGKASVLDEIINYVESLKSQIEFLSMKLASVTPILSDFGLSFDEFTNATENVDDGQQLLQSMVHSSNNYSLRDKASSSTLVFSGQEPTLFHHQDNGSFYVQNEEVDHELELCNMYSFQWMGETDETINHESSDY